MCVTERGREKNEDILQGKTAGLFKTFDPTSFKVEVRIGLRLGLGGYGMVRVRGWVMYNFYESPHKHGDVCVCDS